MANTLVEKKPPGILGTPLNGVSTNAFPITVKKNIPIFKYDLRINAFYPNAKQPREITKQIKDDFSEVNRKVYQKAILNIVRANQMDPFFEKPFITDAAASLYALDIIKIDDPEIGIVIEVPGELLTGINGLGNPTHVTVTIKPVQDSFQANTNQLDGYFKEYANIAVSHKAYENSDNFVIGKNEIYIIEPEAVGFSQRDAPVLAGGVQAVPTIKKSIKFVEDPSQKRANAPTPQRALLILDVSKHGIHYPSTLAEKIKKFSMIRSVQNALKHLEVLPIHRENARTVIIRGFAGPPTQEVIPRTKETIAAYYKKQYGYTLKQPSWPMIRDWRGNLFPIEILEVLPYQGLRKTQEFKEQTERITKESAVLPGIRKRQTLTAVAALSLDDPSFIDRTGLQVQCDKLFKLSSARLLPAPRVVYGDKMSEDPINGKWKMQRGGGPRGAQLYKFFSPATIQSWEIIALVERGYQKVCDFAGEFVQRASGRSMAIQKPKTIYQAYPVQLDNLIRKASESGVNFVMVVTDRGADVHDMIKYLELKYKIITQEITWRICAKAADGAARKQYAVMDNILMKSNVKNQGFNHVIQLPQNLNTLQQKIFDMDRVIVGIEMSHSSTGANERDASVLGWSGNVTRNPYFFPGNFIFVPSRETEPNLEDFFTQVFGRIMKYRPSLPKFFDLYMGGVTEGNMARVAKSTMESLQAVCDQLPKYPLPKTTLIFVSQDHIERFFPEVIRTGVDTDKMNVPPGFVVDKEIVSSEKSEFFLMSSAPMQGTAKAPKYTLAIEMSQQRSMDEIQLQTWALTFLHQYNTGTISIPTPLYSAKDFAKRGAMLLPLIRKFEFPEHVFDLAELNSFTYQKTLFDNVRIA
ncbi:unnamed protein product, partial [Mesorhabditis belari]|uniref:Piwi domain-containing protein n=1 Tax=Mesorhabditis belari TaxID=2138241 RepID=A0AAF3F563_9BILA